MTSGALPDLTLSDLAPAKINLTLRVRGRRADGYHELESLVVFADVGDVLRLTPGDILSLEVDGDTAAEAGEIEGNLVLKAARALERGQATQKSGRFHLTKNLPVAAGIGGGSSDAAAALRLLARLNGLALDDPKLAAATRATGADVPVCLNPRPRIMRGIGDILSGPLDLPQLAAVLVNPRVAVPTARVFAALAHDSVMRERPAGETDPASLLVESATKATQQALIEALKQSGNDLEAPAIALFPAVGEVLDALNASAQCLLARMSGSGGTCFGLFETSASAQSAAEKLLEAYPGWWVRSAMLGSAVTR